MNKQVDYQVPKSYNYLIHLSIPSITGILISLLAISNISNLSLKEIITVPVTLFLLFIFEWIVHRYVLHMSQPLLNSLYLKHEIIHHRLFQSDKMFITDKKQLYHVLMPYYAIFLVLLLVIPVTWLLAILNLNISLLFLITSILFFLFYEWLHLMYHWPGTISNIWPITKLHQLHLIHHHPFNMKKFNFNVTVPIIDWLFGTIKLNKIIPKK